MFPTCAGVLIVEAIFNNFWDILMFILRLDTENDSTFQHASRQAEENNLNFHSVHCYLLVLSQAKCT